MKVLMIGNSSCVHGGITSVINQVLQYDWKKKDISLHFVPSFSGGNSIHKIFYFVKSLYKIFAEIFFEKPDVIYMHMSHHGSFDRKNIILNISKLFNIPCVVHLHGSEFQKWYNKCSMNKKFQIRKFLRRCDRLIVLGEKWKLILNEIEPVAKTTIVNNTVTIPANRIDISSQNLQILFLGVLVKRKGVSDLLDVIKGLKVKGYTNKFNFVIAGSGEEEKNLIEKGRSLGIMDSVKFVGWIDGAEKMKLIKESQIMILPSYNEGLPISILEAMSYGMPVIATKVGDIETAVIDGVNGFVLKPGDVDGMINKIMILSDITILKNFSNNSRKIAEEKFSDRLYFETIQNVFEGVIHN